MTQLPDHWQWDEFGKTWLWEPEGAGVRYWIGLECDRNGKVRFDLTELRQGVRIVTRQGSLRDAILDAHHRHGMQAATATQATS